MQIFINGLVSGAAIALLALAFQAVYLPTRVFFIGLAGIYSATPFIAHAVLKAGGSIWLAALVGLAAAMLLSLFCEWANHAPLARRRASEGAQLIASLGLYIAIVQIIAMIWGNDTKTLRTDLDAVSRFSGLVVTGAQWITLGVAVVLIGAFGLFLMRSTLGLRLRALADSRRVIYPRALSWKWWR